jgi:hypothetical protein
MRAQHSSSDGLCYVLLRPELVEEKGRTNSIDKAKVSAGPVSTNGVYLTFSNRTSWNLRGTRK